LKDELIQNTPKRAARAFEELTKGYDMKAEEVLGKQFEERGSDLVYETVEFYSLCEHHLLPFYGKVHIAYMPSKAVVGLSKLARLVEMYSRRLQIQERLTNDIADALFTSSLQPKAVYVVVEAQHLCMMMRGIKKQRTETVTTAKRGLHPFSASNEFKEFKDDVLRLMKREKKHVSIQKKKN
jgi:GTP cyclohydrolase I